MQETWVRDEHSKAIDISIGINAICIYCNMAADHLLLLRRVAIALCRVHIHLV